MAQYKVIKRQEILMQVFIDAPTEEEAIKFAETLEGDAWTDEVVAGSDIIAEPGKPDEMHGRIITEVSGDWYNYNTKLPFIQVDKDRNVVVGMLHTNRKPAYENDMCKSVGMMATCNSCDRIIFEDETWMEKYSNNGGYCKECDAEIENNGTNS